MSHRELRKYMVNLRARLILEQKFGIRWLGAGFPESWRYVLPLEP